MKKFFCVLMFSLFFAAGAVFSFEANTRYTDFDFGRGLKGKIINIDGGETDGINFYLTNNSESAISGKFSIVDSITLDSGVKVCLAEGQGDIFGDYSSLNQSSFTVQPGGTFTGFANFTFPDYYSGQYDGCIVYTPNGEDSDGSVNPLPRKAIFVTANVKSTDFVKPTVTLVGNNLSCMSGNEIIVTGTFSEIVTGFKANKITVINGFVTGFTEIEPGIKYTWKVIMAGGDMKVYITGNAIVDRASNGNVKSNELTGLYDNIKPNTLILTDKVKVYSEETTLQWTRGSDVGCAGVSGYKREFYEGSCTGTPKLSGTTGYNYENMLVSNLEDGKTYCRRVKAVDNFGNEGVWAEDSFLVDLSNIGCKFVADSNCTSGEVVVSLQADGDYSENGIVFLSWISTGEGGEDVLSLTTGVNLSGSILTGYIYQPNTNKSNYCTYVANTIDKDVPEILSVPTVVVQECTTGTAEITNVNDKGCGNGVIQYSWNGLDFSSSNSFSQYSGGIGSKEIQLKVKDGVGNQSTITGVKYQWTDAAITANNFTGNENVGRTSKTANWKNLSNVLDGNCGNSTIVFSGFIDNGEHGSCTIVGDIVSYVPSQGYVGNDTCIIQVRDDEGNLKDITIYWLGIDTENPTCSINYTPNSCVSGSVTLQLSASETLAQVTNGINEWIIDGSSATFVTKSNGEFDVQIEDLVGNTGSCSVGISNIVTGVLAAPTGLTPSSGSFINVRNPEFTWVAPSNDGCRTVAGYEIQVCTGDCTNIITGAYTENLSWISPRLQDGEYELKVRVRTVDNLGGKSEWLENTINIDTIVPTCDIVYNDTCVSGSVVLTLDYVTEYNQISNGFSWDGINFVTTKTKTVKSNGIYTGFVKDIAGNTGTCEAVITNIKTGTLEKPQMLVSKNGTLTNVNILELSWSASSDDGCRTILGYDFQILSGGSVIDEQLLENTGLVTSSLDDGIYVIKVRTVDSLGGESEWSELSVQVDTTAPICSIEVDTQLCTSGSVQIRLSGDVSDIDDYKWRDSAVATTYTNDIIRSVSENGIYTGYVFDNAGNMGGCTVNVDKSIQDQIDIFYTKGDAEGYECEVITGWVEGTIGDSCGKDDSTDFSYNRQGGVTSNSWGRLNNSVMSDSKTVLIVDGAGNVTGTTITYVWKDTGVQLSRENQDIGILTGIYETTTGALIGSFGAEEGACGNTNIEVVAGACSGAVLQIDGQGNIIISGNYLDMVEGYCTVEFSDDEGLFKATGTINFIVDTVNPTIRLEGTNKTCMSGEEFTVTGTFSETVEGFDSSKITVTDGEIKDFEEVENGKIYRWNVKMNGGETAVYVLENLVVDEGGNKNERSNTLTGNYDKEGPNKTTIVSPTEGSTVYNSSTTLSWSTVEDSGCAGISGYEYKLCTDTSCNTIVQEGVISSTSVDVTGLIGGNTYYWGIVVIDNYGNESEATTGMFDVNTEGISCSIESTACASSGVILTLRVTTSGDNLSWTYGDWTESTEITGWFTEGNVTVTGYVYDSPSNRTGSCTLTITGIDKDKPVITVTNVTGYECEILTGGVTAEDEGCGNGEIKYSWNGGEFGGLTEYGIRKTVVTGVEMPISVRDGVGNTTTGIVRYTWNDMGITIDTREIELGMMSGSKTINTGLYELFGVREGSCGTGDIEIRVGTCSDIVSGMTIGGNTTIIPKDGKEGEGRCEVIFSDSEGNTETGVFKFEVDTKAPLCNIEYSTEILTSGDVKVLLTGCSEDIFVINNVSGTEYTFTGNGDFVFEFKDSAGNVSSTGVSVNWIDKTKPIVTFLANTGICLADSGITVTGVFSEEIVGLIQNDLLITNGNIVDFSVSGTIAVRSIELIGGTGTVSFESGSIFDLAGNPNEGNIDIILGNYDIYGPSKVDLLTPVPGIVIDTMTIDFSWTESVDEGCAGGVKYELQICSDEDCETILWNTGDIVNTGIDISLSYTGDLYWRIVSEDENGNSTYSDTQQFFNQEMIQLSMIVNLGSRGNAVSANWNGYQSSGKILFYESGNRSNPVYTDFVGIDFDGLGVINTLVPAGCYDVVYHGWHHLSSFLSGICLSPDDDILNFVTGSNLYGVGYFSGQEYNSGSAYQIAGDMPDGFGNYNYIVNTADLSALYSKDICPYLQSVPKGHKCDLNNDGQVDSSDASVILANLYEIDLAFYSDEFVDPLFEGIGSFNY